MKTYSFIVREVTERVARVEADSAAEARALLNRWADRDDAAGFELANDGYGISGTRGPISLDDIESIGFTFRAVRGVDE